MPNTNAYKYGESVWCCIHASFLRGTPLCPHNASASCSPHAPAILPNTQWHSKLVTPAYMPYKSLNAFYFLCPRPCVEDPLLTNTHVSLPHGLTFKSHTQGMTSLSDLSLRPLTPPSVVVIPGKCTVPSIIKAIIAFFVFNKRCSMTATSAAHFRGHPRVSNPRPEMLQS